MQTGVGDAQSALLAHSTHPSVALHALAHGCDEMVHAPPRAPPPESLEPQEKPETSRTKPPIVERI